MITFKHHGNFSKTENFLTRAKKVEYMKILDKYGKEGVAALVTATPIDSGETSRAWDYHIRTFGNSFTIQWINTNVVDGVPRNSFDNINPNDIESISVLKDASSAAIYGELIEMPITENHPQNRQYLALHLTDSCEPESLLCVYF